MADIPQKKTLGQRLMDTLTKDYTYTTYTPQGREEDDQTPVRSANPRIDAEIDKAADEGTSSKAPGKKKGGVVRPRGVGCAVKGHGKGKMR